MLEEVTLVTECELLSCRAVSTERSVMMSKSTFWAEVPSFRWDLTLALIVAYVPEVPRSLQAQLSCVQLSWNLAEMGRERYPVAFPS